jgi:hydrogenase maturation protein HypF
MVLRVCDSRSVLRHRITVQGMVQGVGFRPFVYRLAEQLGLAGFVNNNSSGVTIEIEGPDESIEKFLVLLNRARPTLSRIDACLCERIEPVGETDFRIKPSRHDGAAAALIPPDVAICDDCLRELFDPSDRRFRYPFINCTHCGPRYTIVDGIPYDRVNTSMATFTMCVECDREYHDPADRRFHAQATACPTCGPRLYVHDGHRELPQLDPIEAAVNTLREGKILALRGLGGFQLAVDATNDAAVCELRRRKQREQKPLALMAPDLEHVRRFCFVSEDEENLLNDCTRPIVLLRRKNITSIAPSVAYDNLYLGFMLPYTPLHHLILQGNFAALVMTSGNISEEPIAIGNQEALQGLAGIADCFLLHDREIRQRCDDSVVRFSAGSPRSIRRARGYVPHPVHLSHATKIPILACGGQLKNTVALSRGDEVFLSQHIGDLDNPVTMDFFERCIEHLKQVLEIEPKLVVHDLHPDYLSTRWALTQTGMPAIGVQHHHAHLVSVMAENQVASPTIGIILDGTGYGSDGSIWGGEVLIGDAVGFERFAWLHPVPMPGGTAAIKQPWRMALSYLTYAFGNTVVDLKLPLLDKIPPRDTELVLKMIKKQLNSPLTSSCGRLFDGVSAILCLCKEVTYEAQAAIALETAAGAGMIPSSLENSQGVPAAVGSGALPFDWLIRGVVEDVYKGFPTGTIACKFHASLAELFVRAALAAREKTGIDRVALSGGVYQNQFFFEYILSRLEREQFRTLTHRLVPANDGGLALGQVVIGDAWWRRSMENSGKRGT